MVNVTPWLTEEERAEIIDGHIRPRFVWALAEGDPEAKRLARMFVEPGVDDPDVYLLAAIDAVRPWFAELRGVLDRSASDDAKMVACRKLAKRLDFRVQQQGRTQESAALRAALRRLADDENTSVPMMKQRLLERAVFDVLSQRERPHAHRFGRQWGPNESGQYTHKREDVPPMLYVLAEFSDWFEDEVQKEVRAALLERSYPPSGTQDAYDGDRYGGAMIFPLNERPRADSGLSLSEPGYENDLLARLAQGLTPRERELLAALEETDDNNELAQMLDVTPSTVRVMRRNLRKSI